MYRLVTFPDDGVVIRYTRDTELYSSYIFNDLVDRIHKDLLVILVVSDDYSEPTIIDFRLKRFDSMRMLATFFFWNLDLFCNHQTVVFTPSRVDITIGGSKYYDKTAVREISVEGDEEKTIVYRYSLGDICVCLNGNEDEAIVLSVRNKMLHIGGIKREPEIFKCDYIDIVGIVKMPELSYYIIYLNDGTRLEYCYDYETRITIRRSKKRYSTMSRDSWLASKLFEVK